MRLLPGTLLLALVMLLMAGCRTTPAKPRYTGLWDVPKLQQTPAATWGARSNRVQEVWYEGEPFEGKPTRVFAYVGRPTEGRGPFPAMVLVHGGGGQAFADWADHWAARGYVAIAMSHGGDGKGNRLPGGGPVLHDDLTFRNFTDADARDMWAYHAVAAVIRGHSLLASLPEVDPKRIGITGISWGGYLTCIVAGLDDRLKVAVPVYGCGFLAENSFWKAPRFDPMPPDQRARWTRHFDPSEYLSQVNCPILFLNGSNDFAYPMDSHRKSYQLVPEPYRNISIILNLPHGHIWTFGEVDACVDAVLRGGAPLPRLSPPAQNAGEVVARVLPGASASKAELHYTTDTGAWQTRQWKTQTATVREDAITASLPMDRPLTYYLSATDSRGLRVSTVYGEIIGSAKP